MRLYAQIIRRQIEEFNDKKRKGNPDFQTYFSALSKVLADTQTELSTQEQEYLKVLWHKYRYGLMKNAIRSTTKTKSTDEEEIEKYRREVKRKYLLQKMQVQQELERITEKHYQLISNYLEPYAEQEKTQIQEELIGMWVLGSVE